MRKSHVTLAGNKFSFEEILLIALHYNANGDKYSPMVYFFGGNWAKFTYPINFFSSFIFKKYYHRISGRSLRYWAEMGEIDSFRESVWRNACFDEDRNQDVPIPLAAFRVMMWCDTMLPHSTCAPGQGPVNRDDERYAFAFLLQRAFYTKYGKIWGCKTQACLLPNGMIANAWCCGICHNDKGAINLSGLEVEMKTAFQNHRLGEGNEYPAMFTDNIYMPSEVLVCRRHQEGEYWERMTSMREDVEHLFGSVLSLWKRLSKKYIWKLKKMGFSAMKHILTLFFLTNCYTCLHGSKTSRKYNFPNHSLDNYLDVTLSTATMRIIRFRIF